MDDDGDIAARTASAPPPQGQTPAARRSFRRLTKVRVIHPDAPIRKSLSAAILNAIRATDTSSAIRSEAQRGKTDRQTGRQADRQTKCKKPGLRRAFRRRN